MDKSQAIIVDIDGTISLFSHKPNPRNAYDASRAYEDDVNVPVLEVIKKFQNTHCIIFVSGREDKYIIPTLKFLHNKCGLADGEFFLFMRKTGDKRKDSIIKEEIYRNLIEPIFDVLFWLDDRQTVVDMVRKILKIPCFQVNYGAF